MYKLYFRQALEMLKQNIFFSIITILGTALAIMMIMTIIVTEEIKNVNVAPELHRHRTFYTSFQLVKDTAKQHWNSSDIDYGIFRDYISNIKTPEFISLVGQSPSLLSRQNSNENMRVAVRLTDPSFWKIYSFTFIEGRPFSQEEFESGIPTAIISESMSQKLFKGEDPMGQIVQINFDPYRISGIVKDVSLIFNMTPSDLWIPYTSKPGYDKRTGYIVVFLAHSSKDQESISKEIRECERKYNADNPIKILELGGPDSHRLHNTKIFGTNEEVYKERQVEKRKRIFIFLILLLVPAINLSGLSLSRIKKRTSEIGVRKAFGAKKYIILIQVLYENLITSLIGGFIGLFLSYLIVFRMRNWLLKIPEDGFIPVETLVSFPVLFAVFIVCILINLLSAGIPAYRASRMTIVNSLNQNDK